MHGAVFDDGIRARLRAFRMAVRRGCRRSIGEFSGSGLGGQVEFRDHVPYVIGDDFKRIDWSLYARLGEVFVKRFEGRAESEIRIVLDGSASMTLGEPSKDTCARRVAAAYAAGLLHEGRRLVINRASSVHDVELGPYSSDASLDRIFDDLERLPAAEGTFVGSRLARVFAQSRCERLVVLLSDFLDAEADPDFLLRRRSPLVRAIFVELSALAERRPPAAPVLELEDVETGDALLVTDGETIVRRYVELYERHVATFRRRSRERGVPTLPVSCELPFETVLESLARRSIET